MKVRGWLLKELSDGLARAGNEIAGELKHKVAHGCHETGARLYTGSGFVMYPRGTHDDAQKEQPQVEREM